MNKDHTAQPLGFKNIFLLFLSFYVLGALLADTFFSLPDNISTILRHIDSAICIIFLAEFLNGLLRSRNKLNYMKWGWIDLVSSIPEVQELRWGRIARLIRILRLLRGVRSTKSILTFIYSNRAKGTFFSVALISFVLVIFSSIAILIVEVDPNSIIKSPIDALWWSFVTITTVGYGDLYPVTIAGKIIAAILMTAGVGLFGTFTAFIASYFISPENEDNNIELDSIKKELTEIKLLLKDISKDKEA